MEPSILVIDYDNNDLEKVHREWLKHGIKIYVVKSIPDAIIELLNRDFLLIAVLSKSHENFMNMQILQHIRPVSILIFSLNYDITNIAKHFFYGIESYYESKESTEVTFETRKVLTRFHAGETRSETPPVKIYIHKDLILLVEYRKVFVKDREVELARSDFDMLELLMSQIGRVFTYEQLYHHAYGDDDVPVESIINSVHSHVKRIRDKIRPDRSDPKYIDSVQGVGYRIRI